MALNVRSAVPKKPSITPLTLLSLGVCYEVGS